MLARVVRAATGSGSGSGSGAALRPGLVRLCCLIPSERRSRSSDADGHGSARPVLHAFGTPLGHYVELISYPDGMAYEKTASVKLWSPKDVGRRGRHPNR